MKTLLSTLFLSLWLALPVLAQENLPLNFEQPASLLERAKVGRHEYIDVIYQIRNYFFADRSNEELLAYINMLDDLEQIEIAHKFPEFQTRPVEVLAQRLTTVASKKLDFFTMPVSVFPKFYKWAEDEIRFQVLEEQESALRKKDPSNSELINALAITRALFQAPEPTPPLPPYNAYLLDKLKQIEGIFTRRLFKNSNLNEEYLVGQIEASIGSYSLANALQEVQSKFQGGDPMAVSSHTADLIHAIHRQAKELDFYNEEGVIFNLSTLSAKLLLAYLEDKEYILGFENLYRFVLPEDYNEIANFFLYFNFTSIRRHKTQLVVNLLGKVKKGLAQSNVTKAAHMSHLLETIEVRRYVDAVSGQYLINLGASKAYLSIYKISHYRLGFVLCLENGTYLGSGQFSKIDELENMIISSDDIFINGQHILRKYIKFKVEDGKIVGRINNELSASEFTGTKIQEFESPESLNNLESLSEKIYTTKSSDGTEYEVYFRNIGPQHYVAELEARFPGTRLVVHKTLAVGELDHGVFYFANEVSETSQRNLTLLVVFRTENGLFAKMFLGHLPKAEILKLE